MKMALNGSDVVKVGVFSVNTFQINFVMCLISNYSVIALTGITANSVNVLVDSQNRTFWESQGILFCQSCGNPNLVWRQPA